MTTLDLLTAAVLTDTELAALRDKMHRAVDRQALERKLAADRGSLAGDARRKHIDMSHETDRIARDAGHIIVARIERRTDGAACRSCGHPAWMGCSCSCCGSED